MILSDNVNNKVCILPLVREQQGYELQLNTNIFRRTFPGGASELELVFAEVTLSKITHAQSE